MRHLLPAARCREFRFVEDVLTLVAVESPSGDAEGLGRSAAAVARLGEQLLGVAPEHLVVDGVPHLRWQLGAGEDRVLLLGHHDTVWPVGTLERLPATCEAGVLRGPGVFDMKAGLVIAMHAIALARPGAPVTLLVNGDEETGSATSRALIEETARGCSAALVLEGAAQGGALKTARKGVAHLTVHLEGLAAHAGLEPERGRNATIELARQVLEVAALADPDLGTTVTPSVATSGTTHNTVPAEASFGVDLRAWTVTEQHRVCAAIHALEPVDDGVRLRVEPLEARPPFEAAMSAALFLRAASVAAAIGVPDPVGTAVGGGSDGNLTAGLGIPTLDGLGAVGGGAHADDEHVLVSALAERTALVAGLIDDLTATVAAHQG